MPATPTQTDIAPGLAVKGKAVYLLALIALVQFGYPITAYGTAATILYEALYASMILAGVIVGRDSRRHTIVLAVSGCIYFTASLVYAFNRAASWAVMITYLALIPYLLMLIWVLGRFLATVRVITRDVLYTAIALYLLLGAVFVPLYGLLNMAIPGAFVDSSQPAAPIQWQQLVYYSYTTLTSTGYGDILPVGWWARVAANLEMVCGGLFLAIVIARLVGLYTTEKT